MVVTLAIVALALVLTGPVVDAVGGAIGIGHTALVIWDIAKWPVLLAVMVLIIPLLYYAAPNVKVPGFRWITLGSALALLVWIVASAAVRLLRRQLRLLRQDLRHPRRGRDPAGLDVDHQPGAPVRRRVERRAGAQARARRRCSRADREIQLEPRDEPEGKRTT